MAHLSIKETTELDRKLATVMFLCAAAFLTLAGAFLHLTEPGDLVSAEPIVTETASGDGNEVATGGLSPLSRNILLGMVLFYVPLIVEAVLHYRDGRSIRQNLWYLVFPFLRLCPRDHLDGDAVWIVGLGWKRISGHLETYLTKMFGGPMILIALLVLPVVAIEFFKADTIAQDWRWRLTIQGCSAFIWIAFVFEFVIMVSVVEKKFTYCRKNWIDLAIVLLPLVSYLGAARLSRLMKLKQLAKTTRMYRMRGLALKGWKAVVALEMIDTLLRRSDDDKISNLETAIAEKETELSELKEKLETIKKRCQTSPAPPQVATTTPTKTVQKKPKKKPRFRS